LQEARKRVGDGKPREFTIDENDLVCFRGRLCVPHKSEVKMDILREAHKMHYIVHPGETKMYRDLKQNLWWKRMKVDVSKYVAACEVCQRMKAEHKRPAGLLKPLEIQSGSGSISPWILWWAYLVLLEAGMLYGW
jgi:hypothetical protein